MSIGHKYFNLKICQCTRFEDFREFSLIPVNPNCSQKNFHEIWPGILLTVTDRRFRFDILFVLGFVQRQCFANSIKNDSRIFHCVIIFHWVPGIDFQLNVNLFYSVQSFISQSNHFFVIVFFLFLPSLLCLLLLFFLHDRDFVFKIMSVNDKSSRWAVCALRANAESKILFN